MTKAILTAVLILGCLAPVPATVLSDLAAGMQAGTWAELRCTGFNYDLLWSGMEYHYILQYSDDLEWNPVTQQVLYVGGGHHGTGKFITYDAATNAWQEEPRQSWMAALGHGYDHNALVTDKQLFFHRAMATRNIIWYYNIPQKIWRSISIPATLVTFENLECCVGFAYFPETKSLVLANSRTSSLFILNTATWKWSELGSGKYPMNYESFAKYNPVHKVVWFGGGNGRTASYKLDSAGNVTSCATAPFAIGMESSVQVVDPVSGKYLVFGGASEFYVFDIAADTWTKQSGSEPIANLGSDGGGPFFGTVATPVPDHGVVMFGCYAENNSKVYLYRHAVPSGIERSKTASSVLTVSPNPFRNRAIIRTGGMNLTIFNSQGREIRSFQSGGSRVAEWDGTDNNHAKVSTGIYIIRAEAGKTACSARVLFER